ncbi:MAG: SRPBCC domain-containing protein [Pseudomonadota bacterium]
MKTIIFSALALAAAGCAFAPEEEIVTSTVLPGSPAAAFAALTDGAAYPDWNPFITAFSGEALVGETLTITVDPAGSDPMTFAPEVLVADPGRELRWLGSAPIPGVFDGEHYFILEAAEGGTRLTHGERFSGVALWFMDVEAFRADFEAMNEALARHLVAES